jgi:hypothetical protein
MKIIYAFILLFSLQGFAQDTIVKRSNEKIIAKVLEINQSEVKYKKFTFQDGPIYIALKSEIKYVLFSNGTKETFISEQAKADVNTKNILIQPKDDKWYYFNEKVISETVMLETAEKLKDKKVNHFIKKTRNYVLLKQVSKGTTVALAATSLLVLTGVVNFKNTATLSAAVAPQRGGPRGGGAARGAAQQALIKQRKANAGYVLLGAVSSAALSLTFKFGEKKNAHLVCDLYNALAGSSNDYSH